MKTDITGGFPFTSGTEADKQLIAHMEMQLQQMRVERDDWRKLALDLQKRLDEQELPGRRA